MVKQKLIQSIMWISIWSGHYSRLISPKCPIGSLINLNFNFVFIFFIYDIDANTILNKSYFPWFKNNIHTSNWILVLKFIHVHQTLSKSSFNFLCQYHAAREYRPPANYKIIQTEIIIYTNIYINSLTDFKQTNKQLLQNQT